MWEAYISGPWINAADDPSDTPSNHPRLADDYVLKSWEDVTGQPAEEIAPEPNTFTLRAIVSESVLDAIEADATYDVLSTDELSE